MRTLVRAGTMETRNGEGGVDLSAVWWSSIQRSPLALSVRDIPLCFARALYIYHMHKIGFDLFLRVYATFLVENVRT